MPNEVDFGVSYVSPRYFFGKNEINFERAKKISTEDFEKLRSFMFLLHRSNQVLVEILELSYLFDPFKTDVLGMSHAGEELQDPTLFPNVEMGFPSGESLPICWLDADYRQHLHPVQSKMVVSQG
jgi:hypothetical protein